MDSVNARWTNYTQNGFDFTLETGERIRLGEVHPAFEEAGSSGCWNNAGDFIKFNAEQKCEFEDLKKTLAFVRPDDFKPCYILIPEILLERK